MACRLTGFLEQVGAWNREPPSQLPGGGISLYLDSRAVFIDPAGWLHIPDESATSLDGWDGPAGYKDALVTLTAEPSLGLLIFAVNGKEIVRGIGVQ